MDLNFREEFTLVLKLNFRLKALAMNKNKAVIFFITFLMAVQISASGTLHWKSISMLNTSASLQKKKVLYFSADWCKWCRKLEKEVFADSEVSKFLNDNFQLYHADIDKEVFVEINNSFKSISELAKIFGVNSYPTIVFLDGENNSLGELQGYYDKENLLKALKFVKGIKPE
ncbi:MAG: thioredoxin family protein [Ignavibacteriae bacterium]|nr:thioredoxin family protein [Ignavibacteriota bacterium]